MVIKIPVLMFDKYEWVRVLHGWDGHILQTGTSSILMTLLF